MTTSMCSFTPKSVILLDLFCIDSHQISVIKLRLVTLMFADFSQRQAVEHNFFGMTIALSATEACISRARRL